MPIKKISNSYFLLAQWMTQQTRKIIKPLLLQHAVHDIQHLLLEYMTILFRTYCIFFLQIKTVLYQQKKFGKKETKVCKHILNIWQLNDQILIHPWILLVHVPNHTGMYRKKCKPNTQPFIFWSPYPDIQWIFWGWF